MDQLFINITGFVHSEDFADHNYSKKHAEIPGRTQTIDKIILEFNHPNMEEMSHFGECSKENILLVHKEEYFNFVENQFKDKDEQIKETLFYGDTYTNVNTANVARKCVQGVLQGLDKVMSGQWNNAFCSVRPPGHHAGHKENPNGFCIYNNVAIAAKYAREKYQLKKILIFDWDVHHCDGTESIFYNDPDTLVISIHRYDDSNFYPMSGHPENIGNEEGKYFNINVGWNVKDLIIPSENEYVYAYDRLLAPIITEFNPQLILISAGYDSAKGDPLGQINNTPEGYQYITSKLMKICPKIVAVLEGGYNLEVTAQCALATFKTLLGQEKQFLFGNPNNVGLQAVTITTLKHQEFWQCLLQKDLVMKQEELLGLSRKFIAGGHQHAFQIKGNKLIKKTKESELLFYQQLITQKGKYVEENNAMRKLIPQVFNVNLKHQCLIMENLTFGLENASIIDLKMGFKTYNPNSSKSKRIKELGKSLRSGQNILGFRVAGVKLRDKQGNVILDKNGSQAYLEFNTKEKITELISNVLKSNESEINLEALKQVIFLLNNIAKFIDHSKRFFRCTSILLIVDNISKKFNSRWIDFTYVFPLKEDTDDPNQEIDKNLLYGLISLLEILNTLLPK